MLHFLKLLWSEEWYLLKMKNKIKLPVCFFHFTLSASDACVVVTQASAVVSLSILLLLAIKLWFHCGSNAVGQKARSSHQGKSKKGRSRNRKYDLVVTIHESIKDDILLSNSMLQNIWCNAAACIPTHLNVCRNVHMTLAACSPSVLPVLLG
jgi:hypothetical protein